MIIRTQRLVLREFAPDDWKAMLAYQQDPRYLRFYDREEMEEADARALLQRFLEWQAEEPRSKFQLAITLAETGELIGNVGVRRPTARAPLAEMGYEVAPDHWGKGYATEAAGAMLRFAFDELGLHRMHAHCVSDNVASAHVLEKLGMRREGLLRQHEHFKGRWWDVQLYGLLDEEWRQLFRHEAGGDSHADRHAAR